MSVGLAKLDTSKGKLMEKELLFRTEEVIQNLMANKGFSNSEAYAYAFGWTWVMLSEADRAKLIEVSGREQN